MNRSEIREKERLKLKEERKNNKRFAFRRVAKIFKISFLTVLLIGIVIAGYLGFKFYPQYEKMSNEANITIEQINKRTFVRLDPSLIVRPDGTEVRKFPKAPYKYIESANIPDNVKNAFIAIEDKGFYEHGGFDVKANLRAVKALVVNKGAITQGASTITQQLVKNTFLTNEQTYERKIKELLISVRLEDKLTKEQILEYYVNNIYYGNGATGIETAADHYFSKSVVDLSLSETALLAAIPNSPTMYDPVLNMEQTLKRRNTILDNMFEEEYISQAELEEAKAQEIVLNVKPGDEYTPESYEVSYLTSSATKLVMEQEGFKQKFNFESNAKRDEYKKEFEAKFNETYEKIKAGGYTIVSTIDPVKQEQLQESINQGLSMFTYVEESGLYRTQGAGVTIDNKTNELVAIVGGRTQDSIANTFNRAFLAYRQPGSVIKPIDVYGIEIENGMLASTVVNDSKAKNGPKNSGGSYKGNMTAKEAIQRSVNTVPFELLRRRGVTSAIEHMTRMEFTNIVDEDKNAGIAIGGFTYGVTPLEVAGAFGTFANDGEYIRPTGISSIKFDGEVIYENTKHAEKIFNKGTSFLLTDMLKGVITEKHGTAKGLALSSNMPTAAKTGTTDDSKDGWFAGYTPYYTTTIWVGNDTPSQISNLYGGTYPGKIWKNYMDKIHKGLPIEDFKVPEGTRKMYVNTKTGAVSDTQKPGFNSYEYVPGEYIAAYEAEQKRLAEVERKRIEDIKRAEELRLKEFKDKYGISEEESIQNGYNIQSQINSAVNYNINNNDDYDTAKELLNSAKGMLPTIKVPSSRSDYENQIKNGYATIEQNKIDSENRKKAAEEEAIRLENQRIEDEKQAEIDRIEKEKQDIIDEQKRIEEEKILEENRIKEEARLKEEERLKAIELEKERLAKEKQDAQKPTEPTVPTVPTNPSPETPVETPAT